MGHALADLDDPRDIVERGDDTTWAAISTDRAPLVAWLVLRAKAIIEPTLASRPTTSAIAPGLISDLIERMALLGRVLVIKRSSLET